MDRLPCFQCAPATLALPSEVFGPLDKPPCSLQRDLPFKGILAHKVPERVLARQYRFMSTLLKNVGSFIERFFEFIGNLIAVIFFAAVAIVSFGPLVLGIIFLAYEWDFIGEKTFKVSEEITIEGHVFQKMTKISFSPDTSNQTVFVELETPTPDFVEKPIILKRVDELNIHYFWSTLMDRIFSSQVSFKDIALVELEYKMGLRDTNVLTEAEQKYLLEYEQIENFKILVKPTLSLRNNRLIALKNCVVASPEKWNCNDTIPFLEGTNSFFGLSDGKYMTDYKPKSPDYSIHQVYNWKVSWLIEKLHCGEMCFIDTIDFLKNRNECRKNLANDLDLIIGGSEYLTKSCE